MYSVLMSGYMFANAWTRLSLTRSMAEQPAGLLEPELAVSGGGTSLAGAVAAAGGSLDGLEEAAGPAYAPGSQVGRLLRVAAAAAGQGLRMAAAQQHRAA